METGKTDYGKGDRYRKVDRETWDREYDRIFGKKQRRKRTEKGKHFVEQYSEFFKNASEQEKQANMELHKQYDGVNTDGVEHYNQKENK